MSWIDGVENESETTDTGASESEAREADLRASDLAAGQESDNLEPAAETDSATGAADAAETGPAPRTGERETELTFDPGEHPEIDLETHGDLVVHGWDRARLVVDADPDTVHVERDGRRVSIVGHDDLQLWVPEGAELRIGAVHGDAAVRSVQGGVAVGTVAGDLSLSACGPTEVGSVAGDLSIAGAGSADVGQVSGDLSARDIRGDLKLGTVAADVSVRNVSGNLAAQTVGADLYMRTVAGGVTARVGADAVLSLEPREGMEYSVVAGSDVSCRLVENADANVEIRSGSGTVRIELESAEVDETDPGQYSLTVGAGGPVIRLTAGDSVVVTDQTTRRGSEVDFGAQFAEEFSGMADEIAEGVEARTEAAMAQLSEHLTTLSDTLPEVLESVGLTGTEADRIAERIRRSGERAAARAAEKARRRAEAAARRAERKAAKAERKRSHRGRHHQHVRRVVRHLHHGGKSPQRQDVSDEERRAVLKMLEEGKIKADEAEQLLRALGGAE